MKCICQGWGHESERHGVCFQKGSGWSWLVILSEICHNFFVNILLYSLFWIKDNTTENVRLVVKLLLYSIQDFICPSRQIDMPSGLEFQYFEIQKTFVSVSYMFYPWWYVSCACHIPSPVLVRLQPLNILSALWSELNRWDGSHLDPNIE